MEIYVVRDIQKKKLQIQNDLAFVRSLCVIIIIIKLKEDSNEEATAGIEIKFLGNALRPFVFFNSMGELMSLYWSGAAEEKNSALQV
jgi:hypothetical protein